MFFKRNRVSVNSSTFLSKSNKRNFEFEQFFEEFTVVFRSRFILFNHKDELQN